MLESCKMLMLGSSIDNAAMAKFPGTNKHTNESTNVFALSS
jgi:hypothetical protein